MKDVEKTNVNRQNSRKRMRRRKRNMNIYGLVVLLLVITAGITISYTFLFNINEIRVSGESDMYTAEQIVEASGISEGDNLLRLDPKRHSSRSSTSFFTLKLRALTGTFLRPSALPLPSAFLHSTSATIREYCSSAKTERYSRIMPQLPRDLLLCTAMNPKIPSREKR